MRVNFSTDNLTRVFSKPENDYEGFQKFLYDYTHGREVFDEEGNVVSKAKANEKINKVMFDILELDPAQKYSKRDLKRAWKKHGIEVMEVLEEVLDFKVTTGFRENEFFNEFVEMRNIAEGDRNDFWTEKDVILTVAKVSGDHHDFFIRVRIAKCCM